MRVDASKSKHRDKWEKQSNSLLRYSQTLVVVAAASARVVVAAGDIVAVEDEAVAMMSLTRKRKSKA